MSKTVLMYTACDHSRWRAVYEGERKGRRAGLSLRRLDDALRTAFAATSCVGVPLHVPWDQFEYERDDPLHFTFQGLTQFSDALARCVWDEWSCTGGGCDEERDGGVLLMVVGDSTIAHCDGAWDGPRRSASFDRGGEPGRAAVGLERLRRTMVAEGVRRGVHVEDSCVVGCCGSGYVARSREGLHFRSLLRHVVVRAAPRGATTPAPPLRNAAVRSIVVLVGGWNDADVTTPSSLELAARGTFRECERLLTARRTAVPVP